MMQDPAFCTEELGLYLAGTREPWKSLEQGLSVCTLNILARIILWLGGGASWALWGIERHPWPPLTRSQECPQSQVSLRAELPPAEKPWLRAAERDHQGEW